MLLNRDELVATLFKETDRAQRMKSSLVLVYFGIDEAVNLRLHFGPCAFEAAVRAGMDRILKFLRCYDSLGKIAEDEYVLVLPGCNAPDAAGMVARLNAEAFASPASGASKQIVLSGCYGVATSRGRSPFVVLRGAEDAFRSARARGSGSVEIWATDRNTLLPATPVMENDALGG